ncbi:hypothetical protein CUMW_179750 [Citrus unshiu]|uniref:Uncharacterized protein n=1 Tax=Citrus unshiu TaxID=55188 RepID=A0A2H5PYL8_CITUN|nr:hypothetical protein CUMW_179750 [Citrus unshiu]
MIACCFETICGYDLDESGILKAWAQIMGTDDDVVNWFHGNKLWKMARDPLEPLWIKGGGHCNLALYPDYIHHLCWFTQEMKNMNTKI